MPNRLKIARVLATAGVLAAAVLTCVVLSGAGPAPSAPKYMELGKGPTIVLVHDMGSNRMVWMPTVRKLIGRYHVVMVDLPGHGDSPLPDPFTLEAAAGSLGQVLTQWNPDSTIVVGEGLGGTLALLALKGHSPQVRGVALIDAPLKSPIKIDDQEIKYFQRMIEDPAGYDRFLRGVFGRAGRDSIQGKTIHATAAQVQPFTIKSYTSAILTADASPALKALGAPYLLIGTDQMYRNNPKTQGLMLRDMGYEDTLSVSYRRVKDAAFLVMQDQPDTLAAVLSGFAVQVLAKKK